MNELKKKKNSIKTGNQYKCLSLLVWCAPKVYQCTREKSDEKKKCSLPAVGSRNSLY